MSLLKQAQRFFTALNAQDWDTVVAMLSPSADIRTPLAQLTGGEAYREFMLPSVRAMPNLTHEIRGMAAESDQTLAFELHATGTMTGPMATPNGDSPPTGKSLDVPAVIFWKFEDGLIAEYHLHFDRLSFLEPLGLI